MPRMRRDVSELRKRSINSLVLAIELFNRPQEMGRAEAVLLLLHHAFEQLLKTLILYRTGTIHDKEGRYSYTFDKCLEISQNQLKLISIDERTTLSILDAHRDTAVHYYQEISEDLLYLLAQAAVTLFDELLDRGFSEKLADIIPSRVLPISTRPPKDLQLLIDNELSLVDKLLEPGSRKGAQAGARLRPILAFVTGTRDEADRITELELQKAVARRRRGESWSVILPEIAQLRLDTDGEGIPISLKIKKDADIAVRIAKKGEPVMGTIIKHEINIWDKFNLGRDDLARKLGLTGPRTSALIVELKIQEDPECFRKLRRKSTTFKGYSKKALDRLREAVKAGIDVEEVWGKHRHLFGVRQKT